MKFDYYVGFFYQIYVQCPWSDSEIPLLVQFLVPFTVLYRVHTAKSRKFVLITLTGCCEESLALNDPNLTSNASRELILKSLNPPAEHSIVIRFLSSRMLSIGILF